MSKFDDDFEEFDYLEEIPETEDDKDDTEDKDKVAVVLRFDPEKDTAPRIVAAGKGKIAEQIIEVAEEGEIPVYQDETLVESLSQFEVGAVVPSALYELIAEVLIFLYNLNEEWMEEKIGKYLEEEEE